MRLVAVEARISEQTPRDLRGVRALARALAPPEPTIIAGREGPFGATPWVEDLDASRPVLAAAADYVAAAVAAGAPCVTLATDCALALGTLPALARVEPAAKVLWLDAHADFDTPLTTTAGFLGCMSLAGACGRWHSGLGALDAERVVVCGVRGKEGDFDFAGQREAELSAMTMVPLKGSDPLASGKGSDPLASGKGSDPLASGKGSDPLASPGGAVAAGEGVRPLSRGPVSRGPLSRAVAAALGEAPVYVHLDPDVLDPEVNPVPYGRAGGLQAAALLELLAAVAARGPVLGVEVTAFHSDDDERARARVAGLLVDAVAALTLGDAGGR